MIINKRHFIQENVESNVTNFKSLQRDLQIKKIYYCIVAYYF